VSDVLVIGGGVIGCAVAHRLAARGAHVTVVDPRAPGRGASHASAGMLAPFTEGRRDAALQRLGVLSLALYDALVGELSGEGHSVPYQRQGSVDVALGAGQLGLFLELERALADEGTPHEHLDAGALRMLEPAVTPEAFGGLYIGAHGAVDVPQLVRALLAAATARGATLHHAAVRHLRPAAHGVDVETTAGTLFARHVVLAAGCWSGGVGLDEAVAPVPVQPVRGQLLVLHTETPTLAHTVWGPDCYLVPWPDGTVMIGATVEHVGFDERSTAEGVRSLLSAATTLVPSLAHAAFAEVRVGLRPGTRDDRPIVGQSASIDGLIYATGHYRNGALLAPLTADAVADLVEGRPLAEAWAPCSPARFESATEQA
jgi:glycine oxidase